MPPKAQGRWWRWDERQFKWCDFDKTKSKLLEDGWRAKASHVNLGGSSRVRLTEMLQSVGSGKMFAVRRDWPIGDATTRLARWAWYNTYQDSDPPHGVVRTWRQYLGYLEEGCSFMQVDPSTPCDLSKYIDECYRKYLAGGPKTIDVKTTDTRTSNGTSDAWRRLDFEIMKQFVIDGKGGALKKTDGGHPRERPIGRQGDCSGPRAC